MGGIGGPAIMMGRQGDDQSKLFYEFCLEDRVSGDHLLRKIDRFLDLGTLRRELAPFYSTMGRPSIASSRSRSPFPPRAAPSELVQGLGLEAKLAMRVVPSARPRSNRQVRPKRSPGRFVNQEFRSSSEQIYRELSRTFSALGLSAAWIRARSCVAVGLVEQLGFGFGGGIPTRACPISPLQSGVSGHTFRVRLGLYGEGGPPSIP
jgi:hypothetical protein